MSKKKSASLVIEAFGGVGATARALGIAKSSVSLWKTRGKGKVPSGRWAQLLRVAKAQGVTISIEQLMA